jgi:hypothetical protein
MTNPVSQFSEPCKSSENVVMSGTYECSSASEVQMDIGGTHINQTTGMKWHLKNKQSEREM